MDSASYSKRAYMRLKRESSAAVAVIPDTLIEFLTESIAVNWDMEQVGGAAATRSKKLRKVPGKVGPFKGQIVLYAEPRTIGHFLVGAFGEDAHTTFTAGVAELSTFVPKDVLPTFTVDIARAGCGYVNRFFGVRFVKVALSIDGNRLKATVDVVAQRVFTNSRVLTAVGSGTALNIDQTSGLVATDTVLVLSGSNPATTVATLTVASVTDETHAVVSTIGASLTVGDIVVIKAAAVGDGDYSRSAEFTFAGGALMSFGKGTRDLIQALAARTNAEAFEATVESEYDPKWGGAGYDVVNRMPSAILLKGVQAEGKVSQFHATPELTDILRTGGIMGVRARFLGRTLEANVAAAASGTILSDSTGYVTVTAETAGEAGNDIAVRVVLGTGTLSAAKSGNLVTVTLDKDLTDNTVALVTAAIDALSGVAAAATGTGNVTATANPVKIGLAGGRDANQREMLEIDMPRCQFKPFTPNVGEDEIIGDVVDLDPQRDPDDLREMRVRLVNAVAAY